MKIDKIYRLRVDMSKSLPRRNCSKEQASYALFSLLSAYYATKIRYIGTGFYDGERHEWMIIEGVGTINMSMKSQTVEGYFEKREIAAGFNQLLESFSNKRMEL